MLATDFVRLGLFGADVCAVAVTAWLTVRVLGHDRRGFLEAAIAWMLAGAILVIGAGALLGEIGGFGPRGFLIVHLGVAGVALIVRRRSLGEDLSAWRSAIRMARTWFTQPGPARAGSLGLLFVLAGLTAMSVWMQPAAIDAITYRLPRLAHWLQEGRIDLIASPDTRMNFVAGGWEIAVAWILGATSEGYLPYGLIQAMAGWLTVGATIGLARETGLSHLAALLSGALVFSMGNVVVQFTAAQTDLLTTGVFASAFFLWLRALRHGGAPVLGCVGVALALAIKGTIFYLAPSALLWVLWFAWRFPISLRRWIYSLLAGIAALLVLAGPGFKLNLRAYGHPLGPPEWVAKHHRGFDGLSGLFEKYKLNLTAALAQNFEPHAQPWPIRAKSWEIGLRLAETLPDFDSYALSGLGRRAPATMALNQPVPDADVAAFGIMAPLLFLSGLIVALIRPRFPPTRVVLVWSAGVIVFFLFFHGMHQWHAFAFRYQILVAPWIAIVAAWALQQLPRPARPIAWATTLIFTGELAFHITFNVYQGGWRTVSHPERAIGYYALSNWDRWSRQLSGPLWVDLPQERLLAGFYRQGRNRKVFYAPAANRGTRSASELLPDNGWLVVPAERYAGREGHVVASTWLFLGDEKHPFSVAAYRKVKEGESPPAVIYRHVKTPEAGTWKHTLSVRTWTSEPVQLAIRHEPDARGGFEVATELGRESGQFSTRGLTTLTVALPEGRISEITLIVRGGTLRNGAPAIVELLR